MEILLSSLITSIIFSTIDKFTNPRRVVTYGGYLFIKMIAISIFLWIIYPISVNEIYLIVVVSPIVNYFFGRIANTSYREIIQDSLGFIFATIICYLLQSATSTIYLV